MHEEVWAAPETGVDWEQRRSAAKQALPLWESRARRSNPLGRQPVATLPARLSRFEERLKNKTLDIMSVFWGLLDFYTVVAFLITFGLYIRCVSSNAVRE